MQDFISDFIQNKGVTYLKYWWIISNKSHIQLWWFNTPEFSNYKEPTFLFWFTIKIKLCIAKIVLLRLSRFILFTAFMFSLLAFTFRAIFDEQKLYCKYISDIQVWKLQIQMNHLIIKTIIIWKNWKDVCWRLDLESMIHNTAVFDRQVLSC